MVTVKSSQKIFTEEEISGLTGICLEHLRSLARSKHLGSIVRAAEAAGEQAEQWLFTHSDLMVLAVLVPRCHH
jgi:phage gp46-like protein